MVTAEALIKWTIPRRVRNTLRSPSRSMEWAIDFGKFSLGLTKTIRFESARQLVCHPHAYSVYVRSQEADPQQRAEFSSFLSHCGPQMFLFDIGAHFGIFSLAAALWGGTAVAVDASPMATRMIARQVKLNKFENKVRIVQKTVSDHTGSMEMLSSGVFSDGYFKVAAGRSKRDLTRTEATTLDEMASEFGVPTHIKIDVEGHELAVLQGGRRMLQQYSPTLFLEIHNEMIRAEGADPSAVLDLLFEANYQILSTNGQPIQASEILSPPIVRVVAVKT